MSQNLHSAIEEWEKYLSLKTEESLISILFPKLFVTTDDTHNKSLNQSWMVCGLNKKKKKGKKERRLQSCLPIKNPLP